MNRLLSLMLIVGFCETVAAQAVPQLVNYQGRLTDAAGQPLTNGTYAVQFRLWSRAVTNQPGETLVWGRQYDLSLVNGVFNVILGAPGGIPLAGASVNDLQFAFGNSERYLGLTLVRLHDGTVINDAQRKEILPRQRILSAPFSLYSGNGNPPGTVISYAGDGTGMETTGWLLCDGRALRRSDYPALFAAIATRWGNGSTGVNGESVQGFDFNLPDLRGNFLRGRSVGSPLDPDAAQRGASRSGGVSGNNVGSTQGDQFRGHNHGGGSHSHNIVGNNAGDAPAGARFMLIRNSTNPGELPPGGTSARDNPGIIQSSGNIIVSEGGSETRPKNASVDFLIKY